LADVHVWIHDVIVRITVSHFNFGKSYTLETKSQGHRDFAKSIVNPRIHQ